ncbi:MAG: nickel-dependent lactate racemase [Candidatus Geothermarchaeales archaeon]
MRGFTYYGDQRIELELPEGWNLTPIPPFKKARGLKDAEKRMREAITSALKRKPPKGKVALICDDKTRRTPAYKVLPTLLDKLNKAGVKDEDVTLIVALGTHSKMTLKDMERKVGKEALERIEFKNHDYESPHLVNMGKTRRGTPLWVNKEVANADVRIGIGSVFPHALAGFSGGGKIILPGVAGRETIGLNHSLVTDPGFKFEYAAGNAIFEDMREAAGIARLDIKIDMVLTSPPEEEIIMVDAGDFREVQDRAIEVCENIYGVAVPRLADVAIVSTHPFDRFLPESFKAVFPGNSVTKDWGTIVVPCPLYDGIHSNPKVEELIRQLMYRSLTNPEEVIGKIREGIYEATIPYRFRKIQKKKDIIFVTEGVSTEKMSEMGLTSVKTLDEALEIAKKKHRTADVTILPFGGETIPRLRSRRL